VRSAAADVPGPARRGWGGLSVMLDVVNWDGDAGEGAGGARLKSGLKSG
jgi:hypothetical protein